jgi:hypothetical protein
MADPRIGGGDDEGVTEAAAARGEWGMGLGLGQRGDAAAGGGVFIRGGAGGVGWVGPLRPMLCGGEGLTGPSRAGTVPTVPGRAAQQAGVAAHARARCTGRASPGTRLTGPGRVWAVPLQRAFGQAAVQQARWTSIFVWF